MSIPLVFIQAMLSRQRTIFVTCSTSNARMRAGSITASAVTLATIGTLGVLMVVLPSASAMASAAGCIRLQ